MKRFWLVAPWLMTAFAVLLIVCLGWSYVAAFMQSSPDKPTDRASPDFPMNLIAEIPGVRQPKFKKADEAKLPGDIEVVGVCANGTCRAYPIPVLTIVDFHIVNDMFEKKPISISYCNLADHVRVLTAPDQTCPIDLSVGGLDEHDRLCYLFGEKTYRQMSKQLPLNDYPFVRMTWDKWSAEHPETVVFVGI